MSILNVLSKLSDVVLKPVELLTDWGREPLTKRNHERELEKEYAQIDKESQNKIKEMREEFEINKELKLLDSELYTKKETEIKKVFVELEEVKKDRELQRMIAVSEAIMKYQKELTKLNVNAINEIGNMQLDLREKAQQLVYDKTIKYKELQDQAIKEAADDLTRIDRDFSDNEVAKNILIKAVDKRLANIIDTAHNFLLELNADIKLLNQSINVLAEHGQSFIESHLEKFHVIESVNNVTSQIEHKNTE